MADYKNLVSETLYHEGGLSKNKADNASAFPVPDGSGFHTNKGITWGTFVGNAKRLGYVATPALFYKMPQNIWLQIFKTDYWDDIKGDQLKSQAVANLLLTIAWMSGDRRAALIAQSTAKKLGKNIDVDGDFGGQTLAAVNSLPEKTFFKTAHAAYFAFLKSLDDWSVFKNGWTKRMNELYSESLDLMKNNPIKTAFFFSDNNDTDHQA